MTLTEIVAELKQLTPNELRYLALRSWSAFIERESHANTFNLCDEDDPSLLAALDEAVQYADSNGNNGSSVGEVRQRIIEWTSK